MVLVEPGVQPFVDDIVGRGDHAGAEETDQRDTGQAAVGALPAYQQQREQRAGEDEQVFDPVVRMLKNVLSYLRLYGEADKACPSNHLAVP